jgi:hypothetical protein
MLQRGTRVGVTNGNGRSRDVSARSFFYLDSSTIMRAKQGDKIRRRIRNHTPRHLT